MIIGFLQFFWIFRCRMNAQHQPSFREPRQSNTGHTIAAMDLRRFASGFARGVQSPLCASGLPACQGVGEIVAARHGVVGDVAARNAPREHALTD
jgi:hypothetical protein